MTKSNPKICKIFSILLCLLLCFQQTGLAEVAAQLDIAGHLGTLRNVLAADHFRPLHLRYLQYSPQANNFRLLLDKGNIDPSKADLENASKELLKYFLIGLSLPNDSFWVNLRPDSPDNIIDPLLAQTDIGKILLEADLQLKKDTAKFTSPNTPEGKEYWDKLYQKAGELFGSENVTIPTLTRPWIVPDEIIIRETTDSAYIYKATLKVMLEQDYLKDSAAYNFSDERLKELNEYSSQLIRETIIPKITKEINVSKRYAPLRQVYYSLILASWFKARNQGKDHPYAHIIDRRDLANLTSRESWSQDTYFKDYKENFEKGEYNLQEPAYTPGGYTIRSYFSGGIADLAGGAGLAQALTGGTGQSADGHKAVMGGQGMPTAAAVLVATQVDQDGKPSVISSPDMGSKKVTHPERNLQLAGQIENSSVLRISKIDGISVEGNNAGQVPVSLGNINARAERIRASGGAIERVADGVEIKKLADFLGMNESEVRRRIIAIAQDTDILLVRGRLTLHERGPFGHARRGVSGNGTAIWLGEKLFSQAEITNEDIALLLLEEAKHILAPYADHDVIVHPKSLFKRLSSVAAALGEPVGKDMCEADALSPAPSSKIYYLPEILEQKIDFSQARDYSHGKEGQVVSALIDYLNTFYSSAKKYAELTQAGHEKLEFDPTAEEKEVSPEGQELIRNMQSAQERLWKSLSGLDGQARRELFGTENPGDFSHESFDRFFLFSLPRYLARLGIFCAVEHAPIIEDGIIICNLYALDLYEINQVEDPSVRWHRGQPVTCKKLTLGKRVSIGGNSIDTQHQGGFSGRSGFGVIVIKSEDIDQKFKEAKEIVRGAVSFRGLGNYPISAILDAVNAARLDPLAANSAMLGAAAVSYLSGISDVELRRQCLEVIEHHEIEHLTRQGHDKSVFTAPAKRNVAAQFMTAYHDYAFHEELKARLAELLHMPSPLRTLLNMNSDIRSGTQGTGAWYGSGSHYIFQKIVEIVRQDPAHYRFMIKTGYPVEPQIQAQIFTLASNHDLFMEVIMKIDQMHDEELKRLGETMRSPDFEVDDTEQLDHSAFELVRRDADSQVASVDSLPYDAEILKSMPQNPHKRDLFVKADTFRAGLVAVIIGRHLDELSDREAYEALTRIIAVDPAAFERYATPLVGGTSAESLQSYAMDLLTDVYAEDALPVLLSFIERVHDLGEFHNEYLLNYAVRSLPIDFIAGNKQLLQRVINLLEAKIKLLDFSPDLKRVLSELKERQGPAKRVSFMGSIRAGLAGLFGSKTAAVSSVDLALPVPPDISLAVQTKWHEYKGEQLVAQARFAQRRNIPLAQAEAAFTALKTLDLFLDWYEHAARTQGNFDLLGDGQRIQGIGGIGGSMSYEYNLIRHFHAAIEDLLYEIFHAGTRRAEPLDPLINPQALSNVTRLLRSLAQGRNFSEVADAERVNSVISDDSSVLGLESEGGNGRTDTVNIHERARRMVANSIRDHLIHQISDATDTRYNRAWFTQDGIYIDEETYVMIRGHLKALAAELEKVFGQTGKQFFAEALAPALQVFSVENVPSAQTFGMDPEAARILAIRRMPFNNGGGPDIYLGAGNEFDSALIYYGRVGRQTDGVFFTSEQRFDSAHRVVVTPDGRTPDIRSFAPADRGMMLSPDLAAEAQLRQALDSDNPEAVLAGLITDKKQDKSLPEPTGQTGTGQTFAQLKEELRPKARAALEGIVPEQDLDKLVESLLDAIVEAHLVGLGGQGVYTAEEIRQKARILNDRMEKLGLDRKLAIRIRRALMEAGVAGVEERARPGEADSSSTITHQGLMVHFRNYAAEKDGRANMIPSVLAITNELVREFGGADSLRGLHMTELGFAGDSSEGDHNTPFNWLLSKGVDIQAVGAQAVSGDRIHQGEYAQYLAQIPSDSQDVVFSHLSLLLRFPRDPFDIANPAALDFFGRQNAFPEIVRVLKSGGLLIIVAVNGQAGGEKNKLPTDEELALLGLERLWYNYSDYYNIQGSFLITTLRKKENHQETNDSKAKIGPETADKTEKLAGIDFRALPIVTQAIGNLRMNMDAQAFGRLRSTDVRRELDEIQRMVNAGISPSAERVKEYVQASSIQGNLDVDKVVSCISDILRREEESCCATEPVLKDILVVLESGRNNQEIKEVLIGKI